MAIKAAAYARYSTDRQTENSIAYQLDKISEHCSKNAIEIVAVFTDSGKSGTNTNRAGFQRLVAAAKRKEFEAVVIYDITRGSRDVGDWFTFRKEMMMLGVRVISTAQELGDLTDGNKFLMELISVGIGQVEVLNTRQKSIDGVAVKAKQGVFLGGLPPLGYDIDSEGHYIINPAEAALVREIFKHYAAGKSYDYIVGHLNGALGKRGRPIGKNSLYSILTNERYIGTYFWNKKQCKLMRRWAGGKLNPNVERIENQHPAIIDMDTWERVQARMSDNKRNAKNKARHQYLLSGLIECGACGATYVGHASTNKKGYTTRYYCCGNKYRTHTCKAKNINAAELEEFVVVNLREYLRTLDYKETAQFIADQVNGASVDLKAEKAELAHIERQIGNGVKAILSGLSLPELDDELDRLRGRKSELEEIIERRSSERPEVDPAEIEKLLRTGIDEMDSYTLSEVIKTHITKIYAHIDGSVTVNVGVHINGCGGTLPFVCTTWTNKAV